MCLVFWNNPFLLGCTAFSVLIPHPAGTGAVEAPQLLLVSGKGQHQETPNQQTSGRSAFSACFGVFGKETQEDKQRSLWLWWSWSPAKEPGGVLQRLPQDKLIEDLIPSQFKRSGSLQREASVRVSTRRWNFYHHNFSHLRHYKFK